MILKNLTKFEILYFSHLTYSGLHKIITSNQHDKIMKNFFKHF